MNERAPRQTLSRLDESLLTQLPPFSKLDRRDIRTILDQAMSNKYEEGVAIFDEGAQADRFFMLLDGYVGVVRITPTGEQVAALHIPAGQLLGIAKMATRQVEQRVANALLRLINQTGRNSPDGIEIDFPITRRGFSELTATALHTVSRLLSGWKKRGLVQRKRERIKVTGPHALVEISQA